MFEGDTRVNIYDGRSTSFWYDKWMDDDMRLMDVVLKQSPANVKE